MNEMKLKDLFVSALESGHILNSKGDSVSFANPEDEVQGFEIGMRPLSVPSNPVILEF